MGCAPKCACASPDTEIATPMGARRITELKAGDLVYSVDHGRMVAVPLVRTQRVDVENHHVVRLRLESGARIEMTAAHPTADGRTFGDLRPGQFLDGVAVVESSEIPYQHSATYDILPASDTGAYYANGILVGSTMKRTVSSDLPSAPQSRP